MDTAHTVRFRTLIALFIIVLSNAPDLRAAYADMEVYVRRAEKAIEENSPAMAIAMYSQLLKGYNPKAGKQEQKRYAVAFKKASDICHTQNRFLECLEFASYGLRAAEKANDINMMMRLLGNIGNVHGMYDDFGRAINYHLQGYRIALENNDAAYQQKFLTTLTCSYVSSGDIPKAKECFRKFSLVSIDGKSAESKFLSNYIQGIIAAACNEHLLARHHHKIALDLSVAGKLPSHYTIHLKWELGKTYLATNQPDSAAYYFNAALEQSKTTNLTGLTPKIYLDLSLAAKAKGDSTGYNRFRLLEQEATDSFFNYSKYNSQRNQLVEYEAMVKDTAIKDLNDKVLIQWVLIGAALIIITIALVFYVILMKKNKSLRFANSKLMEKNRELILADETNTRLMDMQTKSRETARQATPSDSEPQNSSDLNHKPTEKAETRQNTDTDASETKQAYLSDEQIDILLTRIRETLKDKSILFNSDFSLNMLAQIVKSNTKYVSWVINNTYEKNFKTLLNELRVREASKMLDDFDKYSNYTIQTISEEVGYRSSTSFIQAFKKIVGITPSVYQKLAKERLEEPEDNDKTPNPTQ